MAELWRAVAEPPYGARTAGSGAGLSVAAVSARMVAQTRWAISGVAVRPVPMAQIGS